MNSPDDSQRAADVDGRAERAMLALILGVVGVAVFQPVGVAALFIGRRARLDLPKGHPRRTMALVGEILGWVSLLIMVTVVVVLILFIGFI